MRTAPPRASGRAGDENRKVTGSRFSNAVASLSQFIEIIAPLHYGRKRRRVVAWVGAS